MAIYAQHAYGKTNKIEDGLTSGSLSGVILSPRSETKRNLTRFLNKLRQEYDDAIVFFDPHFYFSTLEGVNEGRLAEYAYYRPKLKWRDLLNPNNINAIVAETLKFQNSYDVSFLTSPTVLFESVSGRMLQPALQLGIASLAKYASSGYDKPLLVSLAFTEGGMANNPRLDELLEIISLWKAAGFYLVIERSSRIQPECLANIMFMIYTLAVENDYEIHCGYTDIEGLSYLAAGATSVATGWSGASKKFSLKALEPRTGGRAARRKCFSEKLLCSLKLAGEIDSLRKIGKVNKAYKRSVSDQFVTLGQVDETNWPRPKECLHNWQSMATLEEQINAGVTVVEKVSILRDNLRRALKLFNSLRDAGAQFAQSTRIRELKAMDEAADIFLRKIG